MDPIERIHHKKDSTLAILAACQKMGGTLYYFEQQDLLLKNGVPMGMAKKLTVSLDKTPWYTFMHAAQAEMPLAELDFIFMRKDPPVNDAYLYTTYILDHAQRLGVRVINHPTGLRDSNEKLLTTFFPTLAPETIVTASPTLLHAFFKAEKDIICKPLNGMGGTAVFHLQEKDVNANVIFSTLTLNGTIPIVAQRFIPEISAGDKRILLINGEAIPFALARIPSDQDWRGNLAAGAVGKAIPLSERDRAICQAIGPMLREKGLYFVGIDVIGDYLTEINVTSPTGIREIAAQTGLDAAEVLIKDLFAA